MSESKAAASSSRASSAAQRPASWVLAPEEGVHARGWTGIESKNNEFVFDLPRLEKDVILDYWIATHGDGKRDSKGRIELADYKEVDPERDYGRPRSSKSDKSARKVGGWAAKTVHNQVSVLFNNFRDLPPRNLKPRSIELGELRKGRHAVRFWWEEGSQGILIFKVQMRSRDESLLAAAQQALELSGLGTLSRYQATGLPYGAGAQFETDAEASDTDDEVQVDAADVGAKRKAAASAADEPPAKRQRTDSGAAAAASAAAAAKQSKDDFAVDTSLFDHMPAPVPAAAPAAAAAAATAPSRPQQSSSSSGSGSGSSVRAAGAGSGQGSAAAYAVPDAAPPDAPRKPVAALVPKRPSSPSKAAAAAASSSAPLQARAGKQPAPAER